MSLNLIKILVFVQRCILNVGASCCYDDVARRSTRISAVSGSLDRSKKDRSKHKVALASHGCLKGGGWSRRPGNARHQIESIVAGITKTELRAGGDNSSIHEESVEAVVRVMN